MEYYFDIKLNPDSEIRENVLMNKVYSKFHKTLFLMQTNDVGISFPDYNLNLGKLLRIHASKKKLTELKAINWLGGLSGYCSISEIRAVPTNVRFRIIARKQSNMTQAKLKRLIKRNSIDAKEIKNYKAKMFQQGLDNPYLELISASNGYKHRRYIGFGELYDAPRSGKFDSFGLSKQATIPWF